MNRATVRRLSRLETITSDRDARVHVIPAHTDDFAAKRAGLVTAGVVGPRDLVIHVRQFSEPAEPQCWGSLSTLMERAAFEGRKLHDAPGDRP